MMLVQMADERLLMQGIEETRAERMQSPKISVD
jgi:hypothetical protein